MQDTQELVNPDPLFQPVPMPQNAQEAHTLFAIVMVTWVLGLVLLLWMDRKKKK
jgi:uncharacterized membrane protein